MENKCKLCEYETDKKMSEKEETYTQRYLEKENQQVLSEQVGVEPEMYNIQGILSTITTKNESPSRDIPHQLHIESV